jgi:hypothetical protein
MGFIFLIFSVSLPGAHPWQGEVVFGGECFILTEGSGDYILLVTEVKG